MTSRDWGSLFEGCGIRSSSKFKGTAGNQFSNYSVHFVLSGQAFVPLLRTHSLILY